MQCIARHPMSRLGLLALAMGLLASRPAQAGPALYVKTFEVGISTAGCRQRAKAVLASERLGPIKQKSGYASGSNRDVKAFIKWYRCGNRTKVTVIATSTSEAAARHYVDTLAAGMKSGALD